MVLTFSERLAQSVETAEYFTEALGDGGPRVLKTLLRLAVRKVLVHHAEEDGAGLLERHVRPRADIRSSLNSAHESVKLLSIHGRSQCLGAKNCAKCEGCDDATDGTTY